MTQYMAWAIILAAISSRAIQYGLESGDGILTGYPMERLREKCKEYVTRIQSTLDPIKADEVPL